MLGRYVLRKRMPDDKNVEDCRREAVPTLELRGGLVGFYAWFGFWVTTETVSGWQGLCRGLLSNTKA